MKRYLSYILAGLAAYLIFLVATLPAAQVWGLVDDQVSKQFILKDVEGTLWDGRAGEAWLAGQHVSSLSWDLSVLPLLWGTVEAEVSLRQDDGYFNGIIARSFGGDLSVAEVEARMELASLGVLKRTLPKGFEARLSLNLEELEIEDHLITGATGIIALQDARISPTTGKGLDFGDLRMDLVTEGDAIKGSLTDGGGPLQMDGLLSLGTGDGAWNFSAWVSARDSSDPMLKQGMSLLGRPGPDGRINITHQGKLADIGGIFARPPSPAK